MPTFSREPADNPEVARLRLDLARLYHAAKDVLRTCDYVTERGERLPLSRGQVARLRHAIDAVGEVQS